MARLVAASTLRAFTTARSPRVRLRVSGVPGRPGRSKVVTYSDVAERYRPPEANRAWTTASPAGEAPFPCYSAGP